MDVREKAKREIRYREWASKRGIATRQFIRGNPEMVVEYDKTVNISVTSFPPYVTRASVLLELRMRAIRREATRAVRLWKKENPEEAKRLVEEVRRGAL